MVALTVSCQRVTNKPLTASQKYMSFNMYVFFYFALILLLFESVDHIKKIEIQLTSVIFDLKIDIEREKKPHGKQMHQCLSLTKI